MLTVRGCATVMVADPHPRMMTCMHACMRACGLHGSMTVSTVSDRDNATDQCDRTHFGMKSITKHTYYTCTVVGVAMRYRHGNDTNWAWHDWWVCLQSTKAFTATNTVRPHGCIKAGRAKDGVVAVFSTA